MVGKVLLYVSSVAGSGEIRAHQQRIRMVLESKKINFEEVDIASVDGSKETMRDLAKDPQALPPRIAYEDEKGNKEYVGDFEAFEEAVEDGTLQKFLKVA
ncbi:hypothetical protein BaRGS_00011982 [Batillaria attramentaria]|uniref:SH3 domain-binding glutamic acid-rich-like protein n=1 Tax=Batillaria attramentaria TaxID=370345 RepID=A0ABD0LC10_9CAEN